MAEDPEIVRLIALVAKAAPKVRYTGKTKDKFATGPTCRAKAASLRTIATQLTDVIYKARMLAMADDWDLKAAEYEAQGL
jgi:hypothetical protein